MTGEPTAKAGKTLGRYRIERELGRGGMGVVYVATDEHTGKEVALKTTSVAGLGGGEKSRNQRRQRFVREVQALTQLNHPNVVHVFDAGEADDPDLGWLLYYAMEYVDGETLAQRVQRTGPLEPGAAADVLVQIASGLGAAHRAGIVHRDVKPANIFISRDGRALIGDFGICKIEGQTQITRRDQLVGTPNYLAPEQILGDPIGPTADVFALGALFYIVTMNRALRSQVDAASLLKSAQSNAPKERVLVERGLPDGLRQVIARCLEREAGARFADGSAVAQALAPYASRVPALGDERPRADAAAYPPVQDGAGVEGSGSVEDVEAVARAMLAEVSQRKSSKPAAAPALPLPAEMDDAPLPVAKTESTAMFNIRELQERERAKLGLPVARTESTAMFRLQELADQALPHDDGDQAQAPAPDPRDNGPNASGVWGHARERVVRLPRVLRVGLSAAGGAACGLAFMLALAPAAKRADAASSASSQATESAFDRPRPALCPASVDGRVISPKDQSSAAGLLQEARRLEADGGQTGAILALLERAIALDPKEPDAYFESGRMMLKAGRDVEAEGAFDCVCIVARTHPKCDKVKKLRERETADTRR